MIHGPWGFRGWFCVGEIAMCVQERVQQRGDQFICVSDEY
jgi:hypothetical protein